MTTMDIIPVPSSKVSVSHSYGDNDPRRKQLLTGLICLCYGAYGMGFSIIGPTLIDITNLLGSTIELVSYGFVIRSICFLSGSLFYGWLYGKLNRQLGLIVNITGLGLCIFAIPRVRTLSAFVVTQGLLGFVSSGIEVATSAWLLEMWRHDSNPYLQCMHCFYALGTVVSPLISEPFLSPEKTSATKVSETELDAPSQVHIPYTLCSTLILFMATMQLVMLCLSPYKPVKSSNVIDAQTVNSSEEDKESLLGSSGDENSHVTKNYLKKLVIVGGLMLSFDVVVELNSSTYLQAFVVNIDLHLSKSKGAFMTSALSSAFAVGRVVAIFLATKLRPATMLWLDFALVLIANLIILTYANSSENGLWLGLVLLGFGYASCFPAIYAFIEERISITDMISGTFLFLSSIGFTIEPLIGGKLIESSPLIFVYVNLVSVLMCALLLGYVNFAKSLRFQNSRIKLP